MLVDHHDAADLLLVHQRHRFTQRRRRAAGHRVAHGQFAQARIQRVLSAERFHGFLLDLLVDLIQQTADATQGEVAKSAGKREQFDERQLVQLQAEGVFGGKVFGAGRTLTQQRGEGKHSPVVISKVVSVPPLAVCGRSPTTRPCLTM